MATPLGTTFFTEENVVAQANFKLMGSTIESFVVEFDQEKYEKLLSSGSLSSKATRNFHKIISKPRSLALTEAHSQESASSKSSQETFNKTRASNPLRVPKASHETKMICAQVTDANFVSNNPNANFTSKHPNAIVAFNKPNTNFVFKSLKDS